MELEQLAESVKHHNTYLPLMDAKITALEAKINALESNKLTVTLKQASFISGIAVSGLRELYNKGVLKGVKPEKNILIHLTSLKAYLNIPQIGI